MKEINYKIWTVFYQEFADKLLKYKNNRNELIQIIREVYNITGIKLPTLEKDNDIVDIDPFTVFGLFNKGITDKNRIAIITAFAKVLDIQKTIPITFEGIPIFNNLSATVYFFKNERGDNDIQTLWNLYETAIQYSDSPSDEGKQLFAKYFDIAQNQKGTKWKLTMGLYWCRPYTYINLDGLNRVFICNDNQLSPIVVNITPRLIKNHVPDGMKYLELSSVIDSTLATNQYVFKNLPELSHFAWINKSNDDALENDEVLEEMDLSNINIQDIDIYDKNMILYGPPGTGKTYNSKTYAVAICDNKSVDELTDYNYVVQRYNELEKQQRIAFTTFHQSYGYEEFIEGIKPVIGGETCDLSYKIIPGIFKNFCKEATHNNLSNKPYVFIIDEINRGNISKIFGELITLIESTKRQGTKEQISTILPYSNEVFTVPNNVYIIGTMNTADRSIALMDTALRRRFTFVEMMPSTALLDDIYVEELNISKMLQVINDRIEFLYDREHTIGHSFFMCLKDNPTIEMLQNIFEKSIIPLLQEYFYEDYQKIQMILGDNDKSSDEYKFIIDKSINIKNIFKKNIPDIIDIPEKQYQINKVAFRNIQSYIEII